MLPFEPLHANMAAAARMIARPQALVLRAPRPTPPGRAASPAPTWSPSTPSATRSTRTMTCPLLMGAPGPCRWAQPQAPCTVACSGMPCHAMAHVRVHGAHHSPTYPRTPAAGLRGLEHALLPARLGRRELAEAGWLRGRAAPQVRAAARSQAPRMGGPHVRHGPCAQHASLTHARACSCPQGREHRPPGHCGRGAAPPG